MAAILGDYGCQAARCGINERANLLLSERRDLGLDCVNKPSLGSGLVGVNTSLEDGPRVFNAVQVGGVGWPVGQESDILGL